jgi:hypothetical protein
MKSEGAARSSHQSNRRLFVCDKKTYTPIKVGNGCAFVDSTQTTTNSAADVTNFAKLLTNRIPCHLRKHRNNLITVSFGASFVELLLWKFLSCGLSFPKQLQNPQGLYELINTTDGSNLHLDNWPVTKSVKLRPVDRA